MRGKYKKHENDNGNKNVEDSNHGADEGAVGAPAQEETKTVAAPEVSSKSEKPQTPPPAPKKEKVEEVVHPSLQDTLDALKKVNLEVNTDVARECLAEFGAARCSGIAEDRRQAFIDLCHSKLQGWYD